MTGRSTEINTPKASQSLAVLDVGHGNCTVLVDTGGVVVIDTGPRSCLLEYLAQLGIDTVDVVLISHADRDHIEGLVQLLASKEVTVRCVRLNSDAMKDTELWDDLAYELDKASGAGRVDFEPYLVRDVSGAYDRGSIHIEIAAPSKYLAAKSPGSTDRKGRPLTSHSLSATIRLADDKGNPLVLLSGDLDETGLENLLDSDAPIGAPLLVFPHHGGSTGSGRVEGFVQSLCRAVRPKTVVFSVGRTDRPSLPRKDVLRVVREELPDASVLCTQLSFHCSKEEPAAVPEHIGVAFAAGGERRFCCAGTILISLRDGVVAWPQMPDYDKFRGELPSPMCCS